MAVRAAVGTEQQLGIEVGEQPPALQAFIVVECAAKLCRAELGDAAFIPFPKAFGLVGQLLQVKSQLLRLGFG